MDIRIFKRMWMVYLNWSVRQLHNLSKRYLDKCLTY